jgi:alkylhydroperoxidase family enzyme
VNTATETLFAPLVIATAPDSSKPILEQVEKSYIFIPNLLAILAALQGYLALNAIWEDGSFPPRGRQLILLAASVENECDYCMSVHSSIAKNALHIPAHIISAILNNTSLPDVTLNALITLVKELIRERGYASEASVQNFIAVGYRKEQLIELLLAIALKTISNYLDHISPAPIDLAFAAENT